MTKIMDVYFSGIPLKLPDTPEIHRLFEKYNYDTFPTNFCGAGKGISELIVPDHIMGFSKYFKWIGLDFSIKISPACAGHDEDWFIADPTWTAFREANERFEENIESIVEVKARNEWIKAKAMYRSITYSNAVSLHGKSIFWTIKREQGYHVDKVVREMYYNAEADRHVDQFLLMRELR